MWVSHTNSWVQSDIFALPTELRRNRRKADSGNESALMCWRCAIFPTRLQVSIVASAELNFCVRNGNRWTLCEISPTACQHCAIFPTRLQVSIVASAELNFCVRNGNRWTLCEITLTHCFRLSAPRSYGGAPSGTRTPDPLIKSQLLYQLS